MAPTTDPSGIGGEMGAFLQAMLDAVFPPACVACDAGLEEQGAFCAACQPALEAVGPHCARCGEPGNRPGTCRRCRTAPGPVTRAFAPYVHFGPLARAIHRFKYEDHPELSRPLAQVMAAGAHPFLHQAPEWVCAVPLHPRRLQTRRYDQAALLARELARATGRPPPLRALLRVRDTQRQVGLDEDARAQNVTGAFRGTRAAQGRRVLLVDDVLTTGATARAAAHALLEDGAEEVQVLALARAHTA